MSIAEILLTHGANPNRYAKYGQPILAYALLRAHQPLIRLLKQYGANVNFAKDYINIKLLGHRFELTGHVDIYTIDNRFVEVPYEGFFLEFTLGIIERSLSQFWEEQVDKLPTLVQPHLPTLVQALNTASTLRRYRHRRINIAEHREKIHALLNQNALIIPVSYEGHAITFIKHGQLFARCDRGIFSKKHGAVNIYRVQKPERLNTPFLEKLLYNRHQKSFIDTQITALLGLIPENYIPTESQVAGNCSWANVEASIPTLLYLLIQEKNPHLDKHDIQEQVLTFYGAWQNWDKDKALSRAFGAFKQAKISGRQASIAAILGKVLYHRCYDSSSLDVERAKKILMILTKPEFSYILTSYIQTYIRQYPQHEHSIIFKRLLKKCGIRYQSFL